MSVTVCDVGPRDGLQNEPEVLPPQTRAELVTRLAGAGVRRIEAASFVNPKRVPQMAGAEEVVAAADPGEAELSGLVLNERGYERLAQTAVRRVNVTLAVTESFNRRNGNMSLADAAREAETVVSRAVSDGREVTVTLSVAFGCPFEGRVDPEAVVRLAERLSAGGELVLADSIGVATPSQVRDLLKRVSSLGERRGIHLHNTRNTGYANAYAALEAGVTIFDASLGGIGGCPFAPKATGNIATEDLVYLFQGEGVQTGIDLDALVSASHWLEDVLGRRLEGQVYRAGRSPAAARA